MARDRPSPYGEGGVFFIVTRGSVPRDRWVARAMAREPRSDARVETCEGPRLREGVAFFHLSPRPVRDLSPRCARCHH